jgi:hypothetical protein
MTSIMNPRYETMSLPQLKKVAQTHSIKMYYTKKRVELIRLLSMTTLPDSFVIEKFTIVQLRQQAKAKGLRGFWGLHRDDLVALLYPTGQLGDQIQKEDKNSENSQKNEDPQPHDSDEIRV